LKYKMVVIDIDGTLVDKHGNLAEEDKYAVKRLLASYVIVVLCTGRVIKAAQPVIDALGLKGFHIFYDGALVYNPLNQATMYAKPLDAPVVKEAIDFCRQKDIYLELYSSEKFFSEKSHWSDEIHRKFFRVDPEFVNFDEIWNKERLLKAEILVHNDEEAVKAKLFKDHFGDKFRYSIARSPAYPEVDFVNLVNPLVSKGEAIKKMMEFYGHLPAEVVGIGDGLNDIPLLQAVGVSVAMGNAFDEVKQASNYITLPIEEHGVAAAINFFFPV
jgi:5-amino-6-(5-phospho-D-ribitylamino)uracil phosphatase